MLLNQSALGQKIKLYRNRKGLSQQTLAELSDCTPTHLSCCETGRRSLSLETFVKIANALNISADDLLVDSLTHKEKASNHELASLFDDCSGYERRVIMDTLHAVKQSLRNNEQLKR